MIELEPRILIGDVFEQLATLPDDSIHCVVTSPPYWALRDYGTGEWEGGDPACAHTFVRGGFDNSTLHEHGAGQKRETKRAALEERAAGSARYRDHCRRCGARRVDDQLGLELTPDCQGWATGEPCGECFICRMVAVFREVRRVLRPDGTCWLNIGDSYASKTRGSDNGWDKSRLTNPGNVQKAQAASLRKTGERHRGKEVGLKEKDLVGIPWSLAFALRADGWWLRRDNIWAKRNPMPESTQDRTTSSHEYVFTLAKSARYFFDADAIREEAAWERWGIQTSPKYGESDHRARWMKTKAPDGWDTSSGEGGHGSVPRNGRAKGVPAEVMARGRNKRSVWEEAEEHEDAASWLAELFLECMRTDDPLADTVWSIATEPFAEAHFATFPTKLVEPCVKAGTSERGVCPDCGGPWERVAAVSYDNPGNRTTNGPRSIERKWIESGTAGFAQRLEKRVETTGWRPTCVCYDDLYRATLPRPRASKRWQNITWWERARARPGVSTWKTEPAVVLDPFAGACTTLLVARRLNRASIGVELNADYAELGRRRVARWWDKPRVKPTPVADGQLALLAEGGTDG